MKKKIFLLSTIILLFNCSTTDDNPIIQKDETVVPDETIISFEIPKLTTNAISNITSTNAMSVGSISNDGGKSVISKGMCWSTTQNPTLNNNFNFAGVGIGEFSILIKGLYPNTKYYVRSYAINSEGTAYGNELSFTTKDVVEKIYVGEVLLTNQEEVDTFGANNFTEIRGSLSIMNNHSGSNITDLSSLISIKLIEGNLDIERNYMSSLNGLNRLTSISGNFRVDNNFNLQEINDLNNLTHIGGELSIKECHELTQINGLNNVPFVGELSISHNSILRNINGLNKLSSINYGSMNILANPELTHIDGLKELISVNSQIAITGNYKLPNLNGLSSLTSIGHYLYIENNNALINLDGLINLNSVKGNITIRNNLRLINLCGIQALVKNWYPSQGYPYYYSYYVSNNGYNPTIQELINKDCK
jgi:hypothetical protein